MLNASNARTQKDGTTTPLQKGTRAASNSLAGAAFDCNTYRKHNFSQLPDRRNPRLASYRRFVDTQIKPLAGVTAEYPADLLTARREAFVSQIQIGKVAT